MSNKDFKEKAIDLNFDNMFKGEEPQESEKKKPAKKQTKGKKAEPVKESPQAPGAIPEGYVLKKEGKSQRTTLLFRPTTLKQLRAKAEEEGKSFNELCNDILEAYLKGDNRK